LRYHPVAQHRKSVASGIVTIDVQAVFQGFFRVFLFSAGIFVSRVASQFTGENARKEQTSKGDHMAKVLTKSQIIQAIADAHKEKLSRKNVAGVLESLTSVGHKELKKNGIFVLPGFAKFIVIKKPATKERPGINPFTKEPIIIKAKPARKVLKARPVKAVKDAV
jgi:nucleoid DNA-binding protein